MAEIAPQQTVGDSNTKAKPKNILEHASVRKGLAQFKVLTGMTQVSEDDQHVKEHLEKIDQIEREIIAVVESLKKANAQRRVLEMSKANLINNLASMQSPGKFTVLSHRMADYITSLERATQIYENSFVKNWERPLTALLQNEIQLSKKVRQEYEHAKLIYDDCFSAQKNIEDKIKELENEGKEESQEQLEQDKMQKAKAMFSKWMKKKQTPEELQVKLEEAKAKVVAAEKDFNAKKDHLVQVIQIIQEKRNTELAVEFEKFTGAVHESTEEIVKLRYQTNPDPSVPMKAPLAPTPPVESPIKSDEEP